MAVEIPNNGPTKTISVKRKADPMDTLLKPFKIPGKERHSRHPQRRAAAKVRTYKELTPEEAAVKDDESFVLNPLDINRFPVYEAKDPAIVMRKKFKVPMKIRPAEVDYRPPPALGTRRKVNFIPRPLHDPSGEFAIVLYDPTIDDKPFPVLSQSLEDVPSAAEEKETEKQQTEEIDKQLAKKTMHKSLAEILGIRPEPKVVDHPKVAVVIDPKLSKILRPHQVEGVQFLYKCVTGRIQEDAHGCIMADEMGLGKTLQCITLMWTLLKQSPQGNRGEISKAVVVCPSSLVRNWANELVKWLGPGSLAPLAIDGKSVKSNELSAALKQWAQASGRQVVRPVLIISYETLRRYTEELKHANIGLILCDEGHRLKNGDSLTFTALNALDCTRRVILSGTPIQNDLSEYFALLSFANPGLLGSRNEFRKTYELDILKGRDSDATEEDVKKGEEKLKELLQVVNKFIIRRTNDILSKYLPVKYEHVVFCKLAPMQQNLYNHFLTSPEIRKLLRGVGSQPLKAIGLLKKLCNHPDLLDLPMELEGCEKFLPEDFIPLRQRRGGDRDIKTWYSSKFEVLDRMLARIRRDTNDKIVLISNYTQTLDLIEKMCIQKRYGSLRLDGTMAINKRQKLVDRFNDPEGEEFIFLLSSKAGGCGLNLIGANRLILMDPDWNPAADQQALARVWRDGQKKDCFVYRFIATGTIEEKIFQRQTMKQNLSSCVVDESEDVERLFSLAGLRQLFEFNKDTLSDTHDTFKCKRCVDGQQKTKSAAMLYGDSTTWNHFTKPELKDIQDLLLRQEFDFDVISFVFQYISH